MSAELGVRVSENVRPTKEQNEYLEQYAERHHIDIKAALREVIEEGIRSFEAGGAQEKLTALEKEIKGRRVVNKPITEDQFKEIFFEWWELKGQGDRQFMIGAESRAKAIGMTFGGKLRFAIKVLVDQGIF